MSTLKFTASFMVATEFMLELLDGGIWRYDCQSRRDQLLLAQPSWVRRIRFFSRIEATPIRKSKKESKSVPGPFYTELGREGSFCRFGLLFATLTLSGSSHGEASGRRKLDNRSAWGVIKVRCAMEWVGSDDDPEPKAWKEVELEHPVMHSGVL